MSACHHAKIAIFYIGNKFFDTEYTLESKFDTLYD